MRNYFIDLLTKEAKSNNKIMLMVGDLGFSVVKNFKEKYPKQFINAGVAEQNMTGMAAGLLEKFHVFIIPLQILIHLDVQNRLEMILITITIM